MQRPERRTVLTASEAPANGRSEAAHARVSSVCCPAPPTPASSRGPVRAPRPPGDVQQPRHLERRRGHLRRVVPVPHAGKTPGRRRRRRLGSCCCSGKKSALALLIIAAVFAKGLRSPSHTRTHAALPCKPSNTYKRVTHVPRCTGWASLRSSRPSTTKVPTAACASASRAALWRGCSTT